MEYFQIDTTVILVKFLWDNYFKWLIIKLLFIPFLFHFALFNFYSVIVFDSYRKNPTDLFLTVSNYTVSGLILFLTIYTFYIEFRQISFHKEGYLKSVWNIFDLTTVLLTPAIILMDFVNIDDFIVRPIIAVCLLFFYMRLFYFLRIFNKSSYLVRTILEITYDIRIFLMVLTIGIVGFGASFYVLSNNN